MKSKTNCNGGDSSLLGWIENHLTLVLIISAIVVVVIPFIFSLPAFCRFFALFEGHNVGDAIGGITAPVIGIISILLLCITLKAQKDAEYRSSLENRIFQMVDLYRREVDGLCSTPQGYQGRDVFKLINDQIEDCIEDIGAYCDSAILETMIKDDFKKILKTEKPDVDLVSFAKLDIAYTTVYFGVRDKYIQTLRTLLSKRYNDDIIWPLLLFLRLKPVKNNHEGYKDWKKLKEQPQKNKQLIAKDIWDNRDTPDMLREASRSYQSLMDHLKENNEKKDDHKHKPYYWGHEFRLSHIFRQLYTTVEYIDSQDKLSDNDKYDYVEIYRTQLSNTEQRILMADSISDMGANWELFRKKKDGKRFISTYDLIKNIPQEEVYGVRYRKIYPDVDYEIS